MTIQRVHAKSVILYKICGFINPATAVQLYKSLVLPVLEYGDLFLTSCSSKSTENLQKFQNCMLRLALPPGMHTSNFELLSQARILPVSYRRVLSLLRVMFLLSLMSSRLVSNLTNRSGHNYTFTMPFSCIKLFQTNVSYLGLKCWNTLPRYIRMTRD